MGLRRWETAPRPAALRDASLEGEDHWGRKSNPLVDFYLNTHCVSTMTGDPPRPFDNERKEAEERAIC